MHDLAKMLYRIHIPRILAYLTEREILAGDRMMEEQQEESYPLTPIDKIANGNSLLILKALLPYLPSQKQAGAAFLVKWMEIQNIRNYYHTHPAADLTACRSLCAMLGNDYSMTFMHKCRAHWVLYPGIALR